MIISNNKQYTFNSQELEELLLDVMNLGMEVRQNQLNGYTDKSGREFLKEFWITKTTTKVCKELKFIIVDKLTGKMDTVVKQVAMVDSDFLNNFPTTPEGFVLYIKTVKKEIIHSYKNAGINVFDIEEVLPKNC